MGSRPLERLADKHADKAASYVATVLKTLYGEEGSPRRDDLVSISRHAHSLKTKQYPLLDQYLRNRLQAFARDISGFCSDPPHSTCSFYELYDFFLHPTLSELRRGDRMYKVHAGNVLRDYTTPRFEAYIKKHKGPANVKQLFVFDNLDLQAPAERIAGVIAKLQEQGVTVRFTSWPQISQLDNQYSIQDINVAICEKKLDPAPHGSASSVVCVRYARGNAGPPERADIRDDRGHRPCEGRLG